MQNMRPKKPRNDKACGHVPRSRPAGQAQSETPEAAGVRRPKSARSCASAPRPKRRSPRRANPTSGCARRSTSCRRASCFSMPTAATSSGTRNTPRSTTAVPTCSSRAPGCRTPSASASSAATIPKRSAARKNGSPSGCRKLYQPGERHEQTLADGRVILIEERLTERWRHHRPARRHHRAEAARGLVPAAVRQQSGADDRLRAGRRAHPRRQRRRDRALRL